MTNIEKIRKAMAPAGLEALLLTCDVDCRWATGFGGEGSLLIFPESAWYITDPRYIEAARREVVGAETQVSSGANPASKILYDLLKQHGTGSMGVQEESLSYGEYTHLEKKLEVSFLPAQNITRNLRRVKSPHEVEHIVCAQRIAEAALEETLKLIREGMTERQLAAELEYRMALKGSEGPAFDTICIFGENTSLPHGVPGDRKLCRGDLITLDFGCRIKGYRSDMTRTLAFGEPDQEMRKVYNTVLKAQMAGIAAAREGVAGCEVDAAARDIIAMEGYGLYFGHSLGHSVGLDIHEGPNLSPGEKGPLPAGAVVTCEPGIYLPGRFGVRIEDMLLITPEGCQNLTKAPRELLIL